MGYFDLMVYANLRFGTRQSLSRTTNSEDLRKKRPVQPHRWLGVQKRPHWHPPWQYYGAYNIAWSAGDLVFASAFTVDLDKEHFVKT